MLESVAHFSTFAVFLSITVVGFLFLLVSLIFGELFDHFGGGGFDHDFDHGGPGFFSARVISVFVMAFGGFGAIATQYGLSPLRSSGAGFAGGLVFASIIYGFLRFLYTQQSATEVRTSDLMGQTARVVVAIPAGGLGQVRCHIGEQLVDKIARSQDGQPIPENAAVRIEEVLGETVIVQRQ
jgi:membrane protein implicated in regulation of membrane protease activity